MEGTNSDKSAIIGVCHGTPGTSKLSNSHASWARLAHLSKHTTPCPWCSLRWSSSLGDEPTRSMRALTCWLSMSNSTRAALKMMDKQHHRLLSVWSCTKCPRTLAVQQSHFSFAKATSSLIAKDRQRSGNTIWTTWEMPQWQWECPLCLCSFFLWEGFPSFRSFKL